MAKHFSPRIYRGDARQLDQLLRNALTKHKVSVTITSPPYHDLKNYGGTGQIGYGQSYEAYLQDLKQVFRKVYQVTRSDGSLWVVIDTFKRDKELVPLPFDFSSRLKEIGWLLRDVVIWRKDRTLPWSKHGDTRGIFEYVLVFSKGDGTYKYNRDKVRELIRLKGWWVRYPERYNPKGKSLDEIWTFDIPTQGSWGNGSLRHFCPLPQGLIERILKLTTNPGNVVLDPFAGAGSVLLAARSLGRRAYGIELNGKYVGSFKKRLKDERVAQLKNGDSDPTTLLDPSKFEQLIVSLRLLKFARVLHKRLPKTYASQIKAIVVTKGVNKPTSRHKIVEGFYTLYVPSVSGAPQKLIQSASQISSSPPLSKYGVEPTFRVLQSLSRLKRLLSSKEMYLYTAFNTNKHMGRATPDSLEKGFHVVSPIAIKLSEADYA